ncbi:MAG: carboxypeptidase-like regulatory domain-containing protein [Defluviitaleaceae bacterium]|nr:carboxypeptidase-like regulatory domain-containing protein [Defluviitaleaceae bacterium]
MGRGFLKVVTTAALGGMPIVGASVTVFNGEEILHELTTNESGLTEIVALEAPARALTLDPSYEGIPYSVCNVRAEAHGFATVTIHDVKILDGETSILPVIMTPEITPGDPIDLWTPPHNLTPQ